MNVDTCRRRPDRGSTLHAQAPAFEVASVSTARYAEPGGYAHRITPDSLTMHGVSMGYCIRLAYGLSAQMPYELVGPAWIDPPTDFLFDIVAKAARPVAADQIKLMLQTLLAERWKLAVHRENRNLSAYALLVSRNPPALRRSGPQSVTNISPGERPYELVFEHVSMQQLAMQLGPPMTSRPVVDKTGFPGDFDFTLDLARYILDPATGAPILDSRGAVDTEGATLRAVRDQLGLTLKADNAPFSVLVIDRVEKVPLRN